ncbi:adhesion G- coupled receptor G2-like protein [Labeo rohita]|uniref:Adhesion G-coupled receptor G2-like protein n=1 Tax=Labeo rohita TaxID=84645 RepID=A0A498LBD3_LABRO|nr:adhesion G- coupled receptor G2-like protein [Labeo rohita]
MEEMENSNKSSEIFVMKDAVGLIYVQAKNTETKDIYICYSSNQAMVVESQTDLKASCSFCVKISKEAFDKSRLENNGSAFVGVLRFQNIENKDKTKNQTILNNEAYGITMRANIINLTNNIDMFFRNNDTVRKASCSSWDGKGELDWTTFGCKTKVNNNSIKCSCSHLTFFSVVMQPPDVQIKAPHQNSLTYITHIGCGISIFFLTIALFMHFLLRCWITDFYIHYLVNISYYALVFILIVIIAIVQTRNRRAIDSKRKTFRKQLMMVLSLFLLFGLTWSVAFFSYGPMLIPLYYVFTVLNSVQGFFLFLYYYYIHNAAVGHFSDDPESTDFKTSIAHSSINVVNCSSILDTNFSWAVKIPKEAVNKSRQENNGCAFVVVLQFKNMTNKNQTNNQTVLNNAVYGITMRANISNLTDNIEMIFTQNDKVSEASCVSWDGKGELEWTTVGCETEINNNTIKCSCSHLTFFAVLMSLPDADVTAPYLETLTLISSIGCGISIFFLSIALFMHFLLRKAKSNQATKILMNMFVSLCLLNAAFLSNESVANTQDNTACVFIALVLHYSMLASFTWFFIQALHMYLWLIRQNVTITNYMRKITVLGWVCPAPVVVVIVSFGGYKAVTLNTTSGKIARMCWITNPYIHYIVNMGYYSLVFIFTTGIFIMIVTKVVYVRIIRATDDKRKTFRKQLMMVLSLFLLFGLTWSVAFFSYGPMIIPSYYIFTVLNSFQGFFLFLYYYHIHNDVAGHFTDDPESTDSNTIISQSSINAVENIHN